MDATPSGSAAGRRDSGFTARPGQAVLHTTRTGLVSDKGNHSRGGNKFYKTSPPCVQAQPRGLMVKKTSNVSWARKW